MEGEGKLTLYSNDGMQMHEHSIFK